MNPQPSTLNPQPPPWHRVSKARPCRICGKPDWCTFTSALSCCMRVESAQPARNGGWLHSSGTQPPRLLPQWKPLPAPQINAPAIWQGWQAGTDPARVADFAARLGVSPQSLLALGAAWAAPHSAWAFPMRDGSGQVIGIRLRSEDGCKWAVRGSRQGIFIPSPLVPRPWERERVAARPGEGQVAENTICGEVPPPSALNPQLSTNLAYICEGPTDTAAALSLGLFALGRPSCNCGGELLRAACRRLGVQRIVMVADNDAPGLLGAERVAQSIGLPEVTICPPCKDLREYVQCGGTRAGIETMVKQQVWRFYDR